MFRNQNIYDFIKDFYEKNCIIKQLPNIEKPFPNEINMIDVSSYEIFENGKLIIDPRLFTKDIKHSIEYLNRIISYLLTGNNKKNISINISSVKLIINPNKFKSNKNEFIIY